MSASRTRSSSRLISASTVLALLGAGLAWQATGAEPAFAAAPAVTELSDTPLDASALYFVSYDGLVNNASYRQLPSGGRQALQLPHQLSTNDSEYDGTWRALGKWSAATGSFTYNGATSTTRNLYLHGIGYGPTGRLYASFTWREGNTAVLCNGGGLANHDTGYVYSDDRGRTWRNNAGATVATTGSGTLVSVGSPGLVVDPLSVDHALPTAGS